MNSFLTSSDKDVEGKSSFGSKFTSTFWDVSIRRLSSTRKIFMLKRTVFLWESDMMFIHLWIVKHSSP